MCASAQVSFAQILRAVAAQAGVSVCDIQGPGAPTRSVENRPRQRAVFIARRLRPDISLGSIGRQLGGRVQTTVRSAYEAGERLFQTDAAEEAAVWQVLAAIGVTHLPALDRHARKRIYLEREIRAAPDRLERLRARRDELQPQEDAR
jgi:hypothetical protein